MPSSRRLTLLAGLAQALLLPSLPAAAPPTGAAKGARVLYASDEVVGLAFSPDGRLLACADTDGRLRVAELTRGKVIFDRVAHGGGAYAVAWCHNGKVLASGGADHRVRLWDPVRGKECGLFGGHKGAVAALAFSADGKALASGGYDGHVCIWELAAGKLAYRFKASGGRVTSLAFAPEGRMLAVGAADVVAGRSLRFGAADGMALWDASSGKKLRPLPGRGSTVAYSGDGRLLAAGGLVPDAREEDCYDFLTLRRADTGTELLQIPYRGGALALSASGRVLASGAGNFRHYLGIRGSNVTAYNGAHSARTEHSLRLWEVGSGREVLRLPEASAWVVALSPDGRTLAAGAYMKGVLVWDLARVAGSPIPPRKELEALWKELASSDGARAFRAVGTLTLAGDKAVALLGGHLRPAPSPGAGVSHLIRQLDDDEFTVREAASAELTRLGPAAEPALRAALAKEPSLEVRRRIEKLLAPWQEPKLSGELLRGVRAVAVLEQVGTPEAKRVLRRLARGAPEARLTRDAKAALRRLAATHGG